MKKIFFFSVFILLLTQGLFAADVKTAGQGTNSSPIELKPLTLQDCYALALLHSEKLAIQKEEVDRTLGTALQAWGDVIGDADFVMTSLHQDPQQSTGSSTSSSFFGGHRRERKFVISQPLFQGFRTLGGLSGAHSYKKQRQEELERGKQLLFVDVVNAFYDYLRLSRDVEIIQGILDSFENRIKELKGWVDIGRSRPSEISSAQSKLETFQAELARSKGDLAIAQNLLEFLVGASVDSNRLRDGDTPAPAEEKINIIEIARLRPDVKASDEAVKTSRGAVIVSQSSLWPKISLDANLYNKREGSQSGIDWDALFTIDVPLAKGGTTLGKVQDSYSLWKEAQITHSLTERTAQREIKDAYADWSSEVERHQFLEKAVQSSTENVNFQKEEYEHHLVSNLDVIESLQSLFETKRDENKAFYNAKKKYWEFEIAKGYCCGEIPK